MQANPRVISQEGLELLKCQEGFFEVPTNHYGVLYIGYGLTFYENGEPVTVNDMPCSKKSAGRTLRQILKPYESCVYSAVKIRITQIQYDALVLLCYDIGIMAFLRSSLLYNINMHAEPELVQASWKVHSLHERVANENLAICRHTEWLMWTQEKYPPII